MNGVFCMGERRKGILLVLSGGTCWGASGVSLQYLLQDCGFSPEWMVTVRMLVAGTVLLIVDAISHRGDIFSIWKERRDASALLFFSVFGMIGVQYMYFLCIKLSNVGAASVLQYLMPAIIVVWEAGRRWLLPRPMEMISVTLAILGTFFLVTHGDLSTLAISKEAFLWGVASAFAAAIYTVSPRHLICKWRPPLIIGWAMLIVGIVFSFVHSPFLFVGEWSLVSGLNFLNVVTFGTLFAFWAYLGSLRYLSSSEAGTLTTVEPLSSILLSVALLSVPFTGMDVLGAILVLGAVVLLSRNG